MMQYLYAGIGVAVATIISPFAVLITLTWIRTKTVPSQLPWAGLKNRRFFPKLRACLAEITAGRDPLNEGYERYGKHGEPFVLPAMHWPEVALPPSNLAWLVSQPDDVCSTANVLNDILALSYLSHGPDFAALFDFTVIRRDLTRQLSKILPDVLEEMQLSFEEELGVRSGEWEEANIFKIIEHTSRRFNNRLFVGLPICRDERYISGLRTWEVLFGVSSAIIRYLIPKVLQPLLAPIVSIPTQIQTWRLKRLLMPPIRQRIAFQPQAIDSKETPQKPNDVLQWLLDAKLEGRDTTGMSFSDIAGKTIELNFFSVHTVAINASSTLTDILCYASATSLIAELREEADSIMPKLSTDPRAVRDMVKLDSVIRESLRFSTMGGRGVSREVVHPAGLTTPDGLYLPQGTHVCAVVSSRQLDTDVWDQADQFVPFRFYRVAENHDDMSGQSKHAVHITEDFLSFGLGRHACPGRFFAVQALKIVLGYLLTNFDFEPLTERPKMLEVGEATVPSEKATIKIRRRESEVI